MKLKKYFHRIKRLLGPREPDIATAIAEYINDGLLFLDGYTVVFANSLARKLLASSNGSPTEERAPVALCLSPDVAEVINQTRKSHMPILYEATVDGRHRHFLVSKIPLPRKHGERERQIFVFQDVTFLRENEEAKVNFIGTLSHEIKTPVTSLAIALAMLDRNGFDQELVRIANSDVARLRILLEDLLNVSRLNIVRNPNSLHKTEANLTSLLLQTIKSVQALAHDKNLELRTDIRPRGAVPVNVDPTKISWVLSTLLTDAIRQTPAGKAIDIRLEPEGKHVVFSVGYERRFDSLGPTGHAIVRDIIEAHAGRFLSLHMAGHASVFKFTLHHNNRNATKGAARNEANLTG